MRAERRTFAGVDLFEAAAATTVDTAFLARLMALAHDACEAESEEIAAWVGSDKQRGAAVSTIFATYDGRDGGRLATLLRVLELVRT